MRRMEEAAVDEDGALGVGDGVQAGSAIDDAHVRNKENGLQGLEDDAQSVLMRIERSFRMDRMGKRLRWIRETS